MTNDEARRFITMVHDCCKQMQDDLLIHKDQMEVARMLHSLRQKMVDEAKRYGVNL